MEYPKRYIDGQGTDFEEVIQSLRSFLCSIDAIGTSKGGALIFFTEKTQSDLMVKVFPLKKDTTLFQQQFIGADIIANNFFNKLNADQPYKQMWHASSFFENNDNDHHFEYKVPEENIITYDDRSITFNNKTVSWNIFIKEAVNNNVDKSTIEQCLFASGCTNIAIVPLPILSTPGILLALDYDCLKNDRSQILRLIYTRSRDAISKFLYYRLMDALSSELHPKTDILDEEKYVRLFVNEVCKVLLPYSYSINNGEEIIYYNGWPIKDFEPSIYVLPLLKGKYEVKFRLTSFSYIDMENENSRLMHFIHTSELFKANVRQSSKLVCRLFNLLHINWELRKFAEVRAYEAVSASLSHISLGALEDAVAIIKNEINQTKEKINIKLDFSRPNHISIDNNNVRLNVNNIEIVKPEMCRGNKNQIDGFKMLYFLIKNESKTENKGHYEPEQLIRYSGVEITEREISDNKIQDAKFKLKESALDIVDTINKTFRLYNKELSGHEWSKNENFNKVFFVAVYLKEIFEYRKLSKKIKGENLNEFYEKLKLINKLEKIYSAIDPIKFNNEKKDAKKNFPDIENSIKASIRLLPHSAHTINYKEKVRACFVSVLSKLHKIREDRIKDDNDFATITAIDLLLNNLFESGLINEAKNQPAHQSTYQYNQKRTSNTYLEWYFKK